MNILWIGVLISGKDASRLYLKSFLSQEISNKVNYFAV